jgi:hypothetical protein
VAKGFEETLPDLREEDIPGSGFAITGYTVHRDLSGDAALSRLRKRLQQRGLRLMLDFVPNHMIGELLKIAGQCDGMRCDMAMLVLPEVFERTWGSQAQPFWPKATQRVRERVPDFCFMAEVYWDLEWTLQQQGFDYAYDKRLYDRLREGPRASGARAFPRRTGLPEQTRAFPWKTTTSLAPQPRSRRASMKRRRCSPSSRRACGSFIKGSSRDASNASRRTSVAARMNP